MTRGVQVAYHASGNDVSVLLRIVAVLLCPKSLDGDGVCFDEDESQPIFHFQSSNTSPSTVSTDTAERTECPDVALIDPARSPSPLNEMRELPSPFGRRCDKRLHESEATLSPSRSSSEAGPSRKRFLLDRATTPCPPSLDEAGSSEERPLLNKYEMSPFTPYDAQSARLSPTKFDSDCSMLTRDAESFASAVLERYDAIAQESHLSRVPSPALCTTRVDSRTNPYLNTWREWISLFRPCSNNKHRQDGIAALAQLRHVIRRRGFLRFATDLASLSQTFRTHQKQVLLIHKFMEDHELLGEPSPLKVSSVINWGPLRQLVETGECPAWLLHKALQDQVNSVGPLRPFLSFLAAAAEIYKGLPERVSRKLEKEVEPEEFVVHRQAHLMEGVAQISGRKTRDPGLKSLLELRTRYFDELRLLSSDRILLTTFLSYIGSLRYVKQWSPAETFVLELANALGMHLEIAVHVADRPSTARYWIVLPQLTQLVSLDNLPRYRLRAKCKDLLEVLDSRRAGDQYLFVKKLDVFWSLAEILYEMFTSPEALQAAIERREDFVNELADLHNLFLEEDPHPYAKDFVLPPGSPLAVPRVDEAHPRNWYHWAALRDTVLPKGTSHRDMEALVDVQLRPHVDQSQDIMNFASSIASVMWPRDWFREDAVSSYDRFLEYLHSPTHIERAHGDLNMFVLANLVRERALNLRFWVKRRGCYAVTLAAALKNHSLYNLLVRAANMFCYVRKGFPEQRLMLRPWLIPDFPYTGEPVGDPTLNTFRAHAAHFLEPDDEFRRMLRVLLSIRSFNKLNAVEQIVLDLAAALCVSLPGEPGHSPFWISAETFHSIMAKRPKWEQLFASPNVVGSIKEACWLFDFSCLRLTSLFGNLCAQIASEGVKQSKNYSRFLSFAQYVLEATEREWPLGPGI
eukprot:Blabericola_migrator_1__3711@NODE_210_length_11383_cov_64_120272_g180_i0_p2_GENE_NODE_210_length_11383_cov_64_120272_g180_i0NODE_210_length_11383_cov_64_120272_g180_i0_p2_ORF_typecomplete_len914_score111_86YcgL/PF05166_13/0_3_NODE_210_length_11383_cov_64_120272_g180_i06353376